MKSKNFLRKKNKTRFVLKKQIKAKWDFILIVLICLLSLFGLLMIFNVSFPSALRDFNDKYYYFKEQLRWLGIGLIALVFFSFFDYHKLYHFSVLFLLFTLFTLAAVFVPGIGVKTLGAARWIRIGFINFQPAELAKLSLIIYLSSWFSHKEKRRLISFLILTSMVVLLIIFEPDMGTASIVSAVAIILYFVSGAPLWQFFLMVPLVLTGAVFLAVFSPYRLARVMTFFNPNIDPQGTSYHLRQVLLALGSGGWFGLGLGQSRQKFSYLPEATTDSIFAIIGEELGFLGGSLIIVLFFLIFKRGFKIATEASDKFGMLLATGITSSLILQTIINFSAMVALIPLTGIPLPFLSYGGSNLIITLAMIGILINIGRQS